MDEAHNHGSSLADPAKEYQPWHPQEANFSQENSPTPVIIGDDQIALIKEIALNAMKSYCSLHFSFPIEPECRKEVATKTLTQSVEARESADHLVRHSNQGASILFVYFSRKACVEFLESSFGGSKEYELTSVEKNELGDFDIYSLNSISKNLADPLSAFLEMTQNEAAEENTNNELNCYNFEIHFKDKADDIFVRYVISEHAINEYVKIKSQKNKNSKNVNVDGASINLKATILKSSVDLSYVLNLSVGDLIPIDSKEKISMGTNGVEFIKGLLGVLSHQKAVKVSTLAFSSRKI
jgi:hypothetical protein